MLKERRFDLETQSWIEPEVFEGNALEYLQGIYQGRIAFDPHRFRAANAALPFESPKLSNAMHVHIEDSFASKLERCIERSNGGGRLPATQVKTIEHDREELQPGPTAASEHMRFIPRRRV
jgi:hypothetical protein